MTRVEKGMRPIRTRTRVFSWFLLAIAVLVTVAYVYFFLRLPSPGTGPAGPSVDRTRFSTTWNDRPTVLLGLGDSVTAGFGASPGKSYFERLNTNPVDEFAEMENICLDAVFPEMRVANVAVSGSNSFDCLEKQLPNLDSFPAEVLGIVVLTTGGNDLIHWYGRSAPSEGAMYGASIEQARPWIEAYSRRMDDIVAQIRARFPGGCEIFLANIYDPSDGVGKPESIGMPAWDDMVEILAEYNAVIAACASRHKDVHLVDIHSPFLGHGVRAAQPWRGHYRKDDPHYWFHENIEDPNDRGYDALRRIFLNAMADVFLNTE